MANYPRMLVLALVLFALYYWQQEKPPGCMSAPFARRAVFIDLGANNGDSFLGFLDDPSVKWPFVFPRACGFQKMDFHAVLVEANPAFDGPLGEIRERMKRDNGMTVDIVNRTVVSTRDGPTSFNADGRVDANCNRCVGGLSFEGSSGPQLTHSAFSPAEICFTSLPFS